jgi:tetratricopeptide (TPR) repeat protein
MHRLAYFAAVTLAFLLWTRTTLAEGEGQADLDEATDQQVTAESLADLEKVTSLIESALEKGLDEGQEKLAKQMLAANLFQHADRLSKSIFDQMPPTRNWQLVRQYALKDLEKAKQHDPKLPDTYLLLARLHGELPGGDSQIAHDSIDEAIKLLADKPAQQATAYILKGKMAEDMADKLKHFDAACKADPENLEALQARAIVYLQQAETAEKENNPQGSQELIDKAMADFSKVIEKDPTNTATIGLIVQILAQKQKFDEGIKYADKLIELSPEEPEGYRIKGSLLYFKDDDKAALELLDKALDIDPEDVDSLLLRSQVHQALKEPEKAKADIEKALSLEPNQERVILTRSALAAQQKRFAEAFADMNLLLQIDPTNEDYRRQMAAYYVMDKRPRKAIALLTTIIDRNDKSSEAYRSRGDALLSVGKHAEAIEDYEKALKIDPTDTGVLNNLAWVMATSPKDEIRNAERSIELATKACELTEYKQAHILSTLASGYAEKGDWETAIKWSTKAVELGAEEDETRDQLKKELESYQEKKPWRELQEVEENTAPLEAEADLET